MRFLDLFAGIGGFRRGMELAGHECAGFCECDRFATASYVSMHCITDKQREYLATLPLKQRQREILKGEYLNGEWYKADITTLHGNDLPNVECWGFGAPCQSFSAAGKREGLDGKSGLIRAVFKLLHEREEENRPEWLVYENVYGMLSSCRGLDYLAILAELDALGYDAEWQVINSVEFVPQNRVRVYTVGHLRKFGSCSVLPIEGNDGKNSLKVNQIGHRKGYNLTYPVFDRGGVSGALMSGGGDTQPLVPEFCDLTKGGGIVMTEAAHCLRARYQSGYTAHKGEASGVLVPMEGKVIGVVDEQGRKEKREQGMPPSSYTPTLRASMHGHTPEVVERVENPEHAPGYITLKDGGQAYAVWYERYKCYIAIRKLTPRECFRLQGWTDDYFNRAKFVNSDSQLYKQAGNGITVPVIEAIGKKLKTDGRQFYGFRHYA